MMSNPPNFLFSNKRVETSDLPILVPQSVKPKRTPKRKTEHLSAEDRDKKGDSQDYKDHRETSGFKEKEYCGKSNLRPDGIGGGNLN